MFSTILIPVDLAHESSWRKALPLAVDNARHAGAKLHVMSVVELNMDITAVVMPSDFNQKLTENAEKRLAALAKQHVPDDIPTQYWVRDGRVYREILAVAKEISADLIVLASHRPSLQDYLLGANAAKVVRHADCSVLVVRE
jgi:nucleotide-binding universal stress UspA family protein